MSDDRLIVLAGAKVDRVQAAQRDYQNIATTLDDTVAKLARIVETGSEGLKGAYVEPLKKDAQSIKDDLSKAAVRYNDAATEINKYVPELEEAKTETAAALSAEESAKGSVSSANARPDGQKGADGVLPPEEQQKDTEKQRAVEEANAQLTAAKNRLTSALDALDTAGRRLGDAVSARRYDDGLTDTWKDKVNAFFAQISKIFAIIGMVLAVLCLIFPGVNLLILGTVVAGVITLIADSVLLAGGEGSVMDVVLGAVGLGLAGLGAAISLIGKNMANAARTMNRITGRMNTVPGNPPRLNLTGSWNGRPIQLDNLGPGATHTGGPNISITQQLGPNDFRIPTNAASGWQNTSDWFNLPGINNLLSRFGQITPEIGFWQSTLIQGRGALGMWGNLFRNPGQFARDWSGVIGGMDGFRNLNNVMGAIGGTMSPGWFVFGGFNALFTLGPGLIYSGGRLEEWIPDVN
ncbi:hypothetical protein ACQP2E_19230 [Actinoplanes sp. CA-015351]|uniref:hypothetical protein n=1 Tax=Actinoplanes sp. CA-015351 TaxID=3239897 RepID=UPI003D96CC3D